MEAKTDPIVAYRTAQEVLSSRGYNVLEQNDAARSIKIRAHVDEGDESRVSTITVAVGDDGTVHLEPSGFLVQNGTVHRALANEVAELESAISERLRTNPAAPTAAASAPPAASSGVLMAWNEAARDPGSWGSGTELTCLPAKIPVEDQQQLRLRLSTGEDADIALTLLYGPDLCRSSAQCPDPTGCPVLGLGNPDQVERLAQRLVKNEIASLATVLHNGQPIVTVDLTKHGALSAQMAQVRQSQAAAPAQGGGTVDPNAPVAAPPAR